VQELWTHAEGEMKLWIIKELRVKIGDQVKGEIILEKLIQKI
jgi:hypothetical protein